MDLLVNGSLGAEIGLEGDSLYALVLEGLKSLLRLRLAGGGVIVDRDVGTALGQVRSDQGTEVLSVLVMPSFPTSVEAVCHNDRRLQTGGLPWL